MYRAVIANDELTVQVVPLDAHAAIGVQFEGFAGSHASHWKLVAAGEQLAVSVSDVPTLGKRGSAVSPHIGGPLPLGGGLPPPPGGGGGGLFGAVHVTVVLTGALEACAFAA